MGYQTDFSGQFYVTPTLKPEHKAYLVAFNDTRRMKRNAKIAAELPDPVRKAVGLNIGPDAAYFVGGAGYGGQEHDNSVIDYNGPPIGQPGLWCKWTPNEEGTAIEWDGNEKFYSYVEWIEYLLIHFLKPGGYTLNGEVTWEGEEQGDVGKILIVNNEIRVKEGKISYD